MALWPIDCLISGLAIWRAVNFERLEARKITLELQEIENSGIYNKALLVPPISYIGDRELRSFTRAMYSFISLSLPAQGILIPESHTALI